MLCDTCSNINFDELIPAPEVLSGTRHHATYISLENAARAGCEFCKAIVNLAGDLDVQPVIRNRLRQVPVKLKLVLQDRGKPQYQGASKLMVSCGATIIARLEVYVSRESLLARSDLKLISGRLICSNPAAVECFSVAKDWISQCITTKDHPFCIAPDQDAPLPTRLIDVGLSDGSQSPRLVLSAGIPCSQSSNYAALSHCWGKSQPIITEIENIEQRMKSIPMDTLTRTFRDAITITRNLGLRYIWIDSLCIIQNSIPDWQQEAARMADIYKNSHITLAAESSEDSQGGMLNARHLDFAPIEVPLRSDFHNLRTTIFVRPVQDDWQACITGEKSALRSRAWVLQESLLAPRTIHYSSQQMFWECKSASQAEGNMTPIREATSNQAWTWSRSKRFLSDVHDIAAAPESKGRDVLEMKDVLYLRWYAILRDYSSRKLTKSWDVLPALAGLASEFGLRLEDRYVAGLWRADLLRGLLWSIDEPELCELAVPYRAPSWSWASKIGSIRSAEDAFHIIGDYSVRVLDVQVVLSSQSPYGQISSGMLRLRGRYLAASHWPTFETKPWEHHLVQNTEDSSGFLFRDFDLGKESVVVERHAKGRSLVVVQIVSWGDLRASDLGSEGVLHGLILESAGDEATGTYHRVGVVQMYSYPQEWTEGWDVGEFLVL